jgi:hypothetical protein
VAAACEEAGLETRVLDLCFSRDPSRDIRRTIDTFRPDVVGIGIRNIDTGVGRSVRFLLDEVKEEVVRPLKQAFTGPVVIGGAAAGINAGEMLDFFDLEYAVRGDGEVVMVELAKRHSAGSLWEGVPGLVVRKGGEIVEDTPPNRVDDLDRLPRPCVHRYVDVETYQRFNSPLQVQAKRGCALKCAYCVYNRIEGHAYRLRAPQLVADEIEADVGETGINHIEFTDSTFNIPLDHAKSVLRAVIRKGLDLRLRAMGLNPGAVDEELVDLMKQAGFVDVDLGAESGCDATLKGLGKNFTKEDVLRAGELLQAKNISTMWYAILGGPGETRATVEETLDTLTRAAGKGDLICVSVGVRAYLGTPIARQMCQQNPAAAADNFLRPVDYQPEAIGLDEIKYLVRRAWFRQPNLMIVPDDVHLPLDRQLRTVRLLRLLGSKQPTWKLYILARRMAVCSGIARIQRWLWDRKQDVRRTGSAS